MVKGRIWKPKRDGFWHWQLVVREANRQARVYSGHEPTRSLAMQEMALVYQLHSIPGTGPTPFVVLGVDTPSLNV